MKMQVNSVTWILDKTVSQVDFYYTFKECDGQKTVFLKFNNNNSFPVKISWTEVFSTQLEKGKQGAAGQKSIVIPPGISSYSDCSNNSHKEYVTSPSQVSPTYVAVISKFEYRNVTVEKIK